MGGKDGLLDPKAMDGPHVDHTVADIFKSSPNMFMTYHVMGTGFDVLNTAGVLIGAALYGVGYRPYPSIWSMMGTSGVIAGTAGSLLGLGKMVSIIEKGENATPIPWNKDGVQQRIDGLSHNFIVRVMDLSVWSGIGLATGALLYAGGPTKLNLSNGPLGVVQALSLGSALGGLSAFACIGCHKVTTTKDDDDDDSD